MRLCWPASVERGRPTWRSPNAAKLPGPRYLAQHCIPPHAPVSPNWPPFGWHSLRRRKSAEGAVEGYGDRDGLEGSDLIGGLPPLRAIRGVVWRVPIRSTVQT